jgi:hypothetical protein
MAEIVFAAGALHAPGLIGLLETAPTDIKDIVVTSRARVNRCHSIEPASLQHSVTHLRP